MKKNCLFAMALAACLLSQPCMTALANEALGPGYNRVVEADSFGPGGKMTPWTKTAAGYVDDAGSVIEGALLRGVNKRRRNLLHRYFFQSGQFF